MSSFLLELLPLGELLEVASRPDFLSFDLSLRLLPLLLLSPALPRERPDSAVSLERDLSPGKNEVLSKQSRSAYHTFSHICTVKIRVQGHYRDGLSNDFRWISQEKYTQNSAGDKKEWCFTRDERLKVSISQ